MVVTLNGEERERIPIVAWEAVERVTVPGISWISAAPVLAA